MNEIWLPIKGYEGKYEISNYGIVKSIPRKVKNGPGIRKVSGRLLRPRISKYKSVMLKNNNECKSFYIHQLVAMHFLPNPEQKKCVNHKDGNKLNNLSTNLEWVTYGENNEHAMLLGLMRKASGENQGLSVLTLKQVQEIKAKYKPWVYSFGMLGKEYKVHPSTIKAIIKGRAWK